jgi:hypothetical protein
VRQIVDRLLVVVTQLAIVGILLAGSSDGMKW